MEDFLSYSPEYFKTFIEAEKVKLNFFEKACKFSHRLLKLKAPRSVEDKLKPHILLSGLKVTPSEVFSFALFSFLVSFFCFLPLAILDLPASLIVLIFPPFIAYNVLTYPIFYSEVIRIRAGNETVSIILHMVTYLSLNPVYEKAIEFAASHSHGPLGNDLKKVVWDVHSGRYANIKEALAQYSKKWTLWNKDFVNSLLLLQMIELQADEKQREEVLNTALDRIMASTARQMDEYAYSLKKPSLLLLMLGITLPLLGLVVFPIISIFLADTVNSTYIAIGYTVILPFFLWWFLYRLVSKRPAVFSTSEKIEEIKPREYIQVGRLRLPIIPLAVLLGVLIALPGLLYYFQLFSYKYFIFSTYPPGDALKKWQAYCLSRYEPSAMLSDTSRAMFLIWGIAIALIFATYFRSKGPYEYDQYIRNLESEFIPALFELHTALRQNVPVESAILKVVEQYKRMKKSDSPIALLFKNLYDRLLHSPTSIKEALFGTDGLIESIPSTLIKNVMSIVSSAFTKGPLVASRVAGNIARYLRKIEAIEHSIKKQMADILSNLKSQGEFIGPVVAGITGSSAVIIIQLLGAIAKTIQSIEKMYSFGTHVGESMYNTLKLINFQKVMPPTIMQFIGGLYLIEIVVITAFFITGIRRGFNKVYRDRLISRMLSTAILIFTLVFFLAVLMFQPIIMKIKV